MALHGDAMTGLDVRKLSVNLIMAISVLISAIGITWYVAGEFAQLSNEIADLRVFIAENMVADVEFNRLEARVRAAEITLAGVRNGP